MNILDRIPSLTADAEPEEVSEEDAKRERIDFHRRNVRNGPTSFKTITAGQERRARKRALKREQRQALRRRVRQHHAGLREAANLRGHLQSAGVLPFFSDDFTVSPAAQVRSVTWIVQRFTPESFADEDGRFEVTGKVVEAALRGALNRYQDLMGQPRTPLSPAYTLPVALPA